MIKYNLKCNNNHEFESWFSDSNEFEKLNKKKLLECIYCHSKNIEKSIMSPMISGVKSKKESINLLDKKLSYEKDKLKRYKTFERLRDGAEMKGQYTGAINAEYRAGQMAGMFIDKKEITHSSLEGMSRDQLEQRLVELEKKIGEGVNIIDVTPEKK